MSELNPYAPPLTTDPPTVIRYGRLELSFTIGTDDELLSGIRASMPLDAAEHVGSVVCLAVLLPIGILAIVLGQFTLGLVLFCLGVLAGAIAGFIAREFWIRRTAYRFLTSLR